MKSQVKDHFDLIAKDYLRYKSKQKYYYSHLKSLVKRESNNKSNVMEFGCGTGNLIAYLEPKHGYGFDISDEMIRIAKKKYKKRRNLIFSTVIPKKKFDHVFMCDVVEHLEDPQKTFKEIANLMYKNSTFLCTMANPIYEPFLMVAEKLNLKMPEGKHERISFDKIKKLLHKAGLKVVKHDFELLIPVQIPIVTDMVNKYLEKYLKKYAFIEYFTAIKK